MTARTNRTYTAKGIALHKAHRPRITLHTSTCHTAGKVRFRSKEDAVLALYRASLSRNRSHESNRHEIRFYQCTHCMGYHLTSKEERPFLPQTRATPVATGHEDRCKDSEKTTCFYDTEWLPPAEPTPRPGIRFTSPISTTARAAIQAVAQAH